MPYVTSTGLFGVTMPNKLNIAFDYYYFLWFVMLNYIPSKPSLNQKVSYYVVISQVIHRTTGMPLYESSVFWNCLLIYIFVYLVCRLPTALYAHVQAAIQVPGIVGRRIAQEGGVRIVSTPAYRSNSGQNDSDLVK